VTVAVALALAAFGLWRLWLWADARGMPVHRRLAWGQIGVGAAFLVAGLVAPGALKPPLLTVAAMIGGMGLRRLNEPGPPAGTHPTGGRSRPKTVRSAHLEMSLDAETGVVDGVVLNGRFEGARLSRMALDELLTLASELDDARSLTLLRSYLDAVHPGWQEAAPPHDPSPGPDRPMSRAEALSILGLPHDAGPEAVREAHRRLMKKVHPDAGGSAALAERVNRARDALLGG
jgi:hypothetical protein